MRIAYLCLQVTHEGQASYAHVHEIIKGLKLRGHDVVLFEPDYGDRNPTPCRRLIEFARVQWRLTTSLRGFDVVYFRAHHLAAPAAFASYRRGIPFVQECNGTYRDLVLAWPALKPVAAWIDQVMRWQYGRASAVIAVTPELGDWVTADSGNTRVQIVANGADVDRFRPEERDSEVPFAVFFGALAPWQGILTILDSVRSERWPEGVELRIIGDGQLRPLVESRASEDPRINYLGTVPYEEMPRRIGGALCSLIVKDDPTHAQYGLSPLKVYESMAAGLPIVVSDTRGLRDIVEEYACGLIVPSGDPEALARAVGALHESGDCLSMGVSGRKAAVEHHSWAARAARTADIIERVVAKDMS